jgi:hypothetical protein
LEQPAPSQHLQASLGLLQFTSFAAKGLSLPDTFHSQSPREARIRLELKAGKHARSLLRKLLETRAPRKRVGILKLSTEECLWTGM